MTKTFKYICVLVGLFCTMNSLLPQRGASHVNAKAEEIRGIWVATVFSLDYPLTPSVSPDTLKSQADNLLNNVQSLGYNTLFFQVRPSGDAFYPSDIFPWSKYLTGNGGQSPLNGFDPLEYLISETHKRGIAFHAWINPYRITASANDNPTLPESSIAKTHPHLIIKHADGKLYLNPGEPEATKLVVDGIGEIVKNYNVDGIHIDDYFYPDSSFPDSETFTKYGGGFSDIGDWRRNNTTNLIKNISSILKSTHPEIVFSVSPCGIWANKKSHPDGSDTKGVQAYFDYYADTRQWVKDELIDWIIPQIYWNIGNSAADFETVAKWWDSVVSGTKVSLCIGQGVYKSADETSSASVWYGEKGIAELNQQFRLMSNLENCIGYSHYRLGSVLKSQPLTDFVKAANSGELPLFSDLPSYPWAKDDITDLYKKGVANGMGDGTFGCARQINRADFTLMLVRILGKTAEVNDNFEDVSPNHYFYKEVGIAKTLGITNGRDGKIFDPTGNISRQDMATLVYRLLEKEGKLNFDETFSLSNKFSDVVDISEYALTPIKAMVDMGLLNGYETGEFKPHGFATRAETAVFLNKVSELL